MFSGYSKSVLKLSDTKSTFLVHPKSNREEAAAIAYAVQQCCAEVSRSGLVGIGRVRYFLLCPGNDPGRNAHNFGMQIKSTRAGPRTARMTGPMLRMNLYGANSYDAILRRTANSRRVSRGYMPASVIDALQHPALSASGAPRRGRR